MALSNVRKVMIENPESTEDGCEEKETRLKKN